jgi:hypothetical protein
VFSLSSHTPCIVRCESRAELAWWAPAFDEQQTHPVRQVKEASEEFTHVLTGAARMTANQTGSLRATTLQRPVIVVLIGALLLSTGCTSMRPVRVAAPAQPTYGQVQPGDTVIIRSPDGERWRFEVEQIDGDTIIARGGTRFRREQVVQLWRRSFSGPKTAGLIAAIVGGVFVMIGIAEASALGSILGGGGS